MKGYKVFEPDWTCKGFQYEVGKTFEEDVEPLCCERGFHFCTNLIDCFNYYAFSPKNKVAEIEALGKINTKIETDLQSETSVSKSCTNKIKIIRELSWEEVLRVVNNGCGNTGFGNSGDYNTGDFNCGNYNAGNYNYGKFNTGNYNNGYYNVGYKNRGSNNEGNFNIGSNNNGSHNIGAYNSGYGNNGNNNSGDFNIGSDNSGDYNIGNWNNGDWNKTNFSSGCFNTEETKIMLFNKPSNWTFRDWRNSKARDLLRNIINDNTQWIYLDSMTNEDKAQHPECRVMGGYLTKDEEYIYNRQVWWDNLSEYDKNIIKNIPNFDVEIFKEITGIDVKS